MASNHNRRQKVTRRELLGLAWAISVVGIIGQAGAALLEFFKPRMEPGSFGGEVVAGNLDEFEPGTVSYVQAGRFYIVRLEDSGFMALWQSCTHLGCTIPWSEEEGQFNCPCHSSLFNIQGEVTGGPAPRPMDLFPIRVQDGNLIVDTSQPIQRQRFEKAQVFYPG